VSQSITSSGTSREAQNAALVVKLNKTQVEALMPKPGDFVLTVSGNLLTSTNFRPFEASSAVHFTLSRNTRERHETTHDDKTNLMERDSRADTRTIDHASAIRGNLEHAKHMNESHTGMNVMWTKTSKTVEPSSTTGRRSRT